MWSGPRNLSTAMMYSFGARADCDIWDEPFYAAYLARTGLDHPMRDAILATHDSDPASVAARIAALPGDGPRHTYMKHMPHHMLPDFPMGWAQDCINIHLIRHPARVIASYDAKRDDLTMDDIGFARQAEVFDQLGGVIIDSFDIRNDPAGMLAQLCEAIGIPYDSTMLRWPAGGRAEDGVWAAHWYGAVHRSTGFAGAEGPLPDVAPRHQPILAASLPIYEKLHANRLGA